LNLVSEWKLDGNGSETSALDSWGNNDGTLGNFNFNDFNGWRSGDVCINNRCLQFYKQQLTYLQIGNTSINNEYFSIEFWFKKRNSSDYNCFTEGNSEWSNGYHFWANGSYLYNRVNGTDAHTINSLFSNTKWNHLVLTVARNINSTLRTRKIYLNSKIVINDEIPLLKTNLGNMKIGYSGGNSSPSTYFNGTIDEFRLYDSYILDSQIQQNYLAGLNNLLATGNISEIEYNKRIDNLNYSGL